jgi:hypothetical protein
MLQSEKFARRNLNISLALRDPETAFANSLIIVLKNAQTKFSQALQLPENSTWEDISAKLAEQNDEDQDTLVKKIANECGILADRLWPQLGKQQSPEPVRPTAILGGEGWDQLLQQRPTR